MKYILTLSNKLLEGEVLVMKLKKIVMLFMAGLMFLSAYSGKTEKNNDMKKEEQKVLKVGVGADHKPWCYKDGDNDNSNS